MSSVTDICNRALARVGQPEITNIDDEDRLARLCRRLYDAKRDALLQSYRWRFALSRAALSPLAAAPAFGYTYEYVRPADALRILSVNDHDPEMPNTDPTLWIREGNSILTDEPPTIDVRYIKRVTAPGDFDPMFTEAFVLYLAHGLAPSLREVDSRLTQEILGEFDYFVAQARHTSAIESRRALRYDTRGDYPRGRYI